MQENVYTLPAQVEARSGTSLPAFVNKESNALLGCGILAQGFVRLKCRSDRHENLAGFRARVKINSENIKVRTSYVDTLITRRNERRDGVSGCVYIHLIY